MFRLLVGLRMTEPVMLRVPLAPIPPGLIAPSLVRVAPPRFIVPLPRNTPVALFVREVPFVLNVPPVPVSMIPSLVGKTLEAICIVPAPVEIVALALLKKVKFGNPVKLEVKAPEFSTRPPALLLNTAPPTLGESTEPEAPKRNTPPELLLTVAPEARVR